jgi:hypothetical protein
MKAVREISGHRQVSSNSGRESQGKMIWDEARTPHEIGRQVEDQT